MGINLGVLGQIVCGYLANSRQFGWHWAFGAAGVGMLLGLITYAVRKGRDLGPIGETPAHRLATTHAASAEPLAREEWERLGAIFILAVFSVFFWAAFEQAGSTMNVFAQERTDRMLGGFEIPAPWFQSINPFVIMVLAPLFARLWLWLTASGREPSTPIKMVWGLYLLGAAFVFMVLGARFTGRLMHGRG